mgnify:CR=1 FL=1
MGDLAGELCDLCGGVLRAKVIEMEFIKDGERILCENIPADVCAQCGEKYLSDKVMEGIEKFLERRHQEHPKRYISIPVYEFKVAGLPIVRVRNG